MNKAYAGDDVAQIRADYITLGFTEVLSDDGDTFDLWRPYGDLPSSECCHVVVWPRKEGGYWAEEY